MPGTGQQSWNVTAPSLRFLARRDLVRKVTEVEQWTWCLLPPEADHNAWPQQIHYQHQKQHQVRTQMGCRHTTDGQGVADRPVPLVPRRLSSHSSWCGTRQGLAG